jgi:hypothetical protein
VLEDIQEYADHGYSHLTLHFDVRSRTVSELFELMHRFAEEVLPEARKIQHTPLDREPAPSRSAAAGRAVIQE